MNKNVKRRLDDVFSKFIRLRDSDDNGYGRCISCGKVFHWKDADCGHYITRDHMSTRWDERNCSLQCKHCNRFQSGNMAEYTKGLMKKYGPEILDILIAKKYTTSHISEFEAEILIKEYRKKVKQMMK